MTTSPVTRQSIRTARKRRSFVRGLVLILAVLVGTALLAMLTACAPAVSSTDADRFNYERAYQLDDFAGELAGKGDVQAIDQDGTQVPVDASGYVVRSTDVDNRDGYPLFTLYVEPNEILVGDVLVMVEQHNAKVAAAKHAHDGKRAQFEDDLKRQAQAFENKRQQLVSPSPTPSVSPVPNYYNEGH